MYGQLYTKITVRTFKIHTSCAFLLFVHIPFLGFILIFAGFLGCRGWRGLIWEWGWFRGGRRVNFAMFFFPLNISSTLSSFSVLHEGHLLYWKTVTQHHHIWVCKKLPSCLLLLTRLIRNTNQIIFTCHLISSIFGTQQQQIGLRLQYAAPFYARRCYNVDYVLFPQ